MLPIEGRRPYCIYATLVVLIPLFCFEHSFCQYTCLGRKVMADEHQVSLIGTQQDSDHKVIPYILVSVPVEARLFEDKPVLPPFLGEVAFGILLLPQPALAVTMAQVLTRYSPSTGTSEGTCRARSGADFLTQISANQHTKFFFFFAHLQHCNKVKSMTSLQLGASK